MGDAQGMVQMARCVEKMGRMLRDAEELKRLGDKLEIALLCHLAGGDGDGAWVGSRGASMEGS